MKTFVTGAGGFIGSHLVETLIREGESVKALVHYNSRNSWGWLDTLSAEIKKEIEIVPGDLRDFQSIKNAMRECRRVYHLGALISIPYSYQAPRMFVEVNILGTLNVLQAALEANLERVIHTSTSEVYGTAQKIPMTEAHPLQGQSPYAATKIGADQLALAFHRTYHLPVVIGRPFNTYGPRQSARAVIPTIILQLASGKRKIRLGALAPTRDFNYVQDTVDGLLTLGRAENVIGEVFNLGTGWEISIKETVLLIAEIMGMSVEIDSEAKRFRPESSEVFRLRSGIDKIRQRTGWAPTFVGRKGFRRGLVRTIEWFSHPENQRYYHPDLYQI